VISCVQTQEGLPLVDGQDSAVETKKVHTYSGAWALQGNGYEAVSYPSPKVRCGRSHSACSVTVVRFHSTHMRMSPCVAAHSGCKSGLKVEQCPTVYAFTTQLSLLLYVAAGWRKTS
jgi:hypothetical protein